MSTNRSFRFIDSHCHLDADEFKFDLNEMRERARQQGVDLCLIPSVDKNNFKDVRDLAHRFNDLYALGTHPLYTLGAAVEDIAVLREHLANAFQGLDHSSSKDPLLVAVGEIGLDGAVKSLDWQRQVYFFEQQLKVALDFDLPVVLHVRQAVDFVLKGLRKFKVKGGIAHAFNGSLQQAEQFIAMGFKLGLGGALTYPRALHLRKLARELPAESIVLETDSPDIVPVWGYVNALLRAGGHPQGRNEPCELPRIAQEIADIRGVPLDSMMKLSTSNFLNIFNLNVSHQTP